MVEPASHYEHLSAWRMKKGLSQEQIANMLDVNKSTVSRWENGKRALDLNDLNRLAEIYGVDPLALLMSPDDFELARRLTEAKLILESARPEAAERWLATGRDIARLDKK